MPQQDQSGLVRISRSGTIQPKQYTSLSVTVDLSLPIEAGEEVEAAIARVDSLVMNSFLEKVCELLKDGKDIVNGGA